MHTTFYPTRFSPSVSRRFTLSRWFLSLFFICCLPGQFLWAQEDLVGIWTGDLEVQGVKLGLVFNIESDGVNFHGSLDIPLQGVEGLALSAVKQDGDKVLFEISAIKGEFKGNFETPQVLGGDWNQAGMTFPLTLNKADSKPVMNRPQEPTAPFPYLVEDIEIPNPHVSDVTLSGTLTLPKDASASTPLAILVSGSGPSNRDEDACGHKPCLVLSDALTRQGIAVFRYDDRGVEASTGDHDAATSADLAVDAGAIVEHFRTDKRFAPDKIGIVGHSEGGLIAPMVAKEKPDLGFIVLLAGPGVSGEEVLIDQSRIGGLGEGLSEEAVESNIGLIRTIMGILKGKKNGAELEEALMVEVQEFLDGISDPIKEELGADPKTIKQKLGGMMSPWFRYFIAHDPAKVLKKVKVPTLVLLGEKDQQVSPELNQEPLAKALKKVKSDHKELKVFPDANHLFQTCETGAVAEYGELEETMSTTVTDYIGDWIKRAF